MSAVRIVLLGNPQLSHRDGTTIQLRRRPRLLLYFLAAQVDAISRERCIQLFWPNDDPDAARQLLRTALHQIKSSCGDIIQSDHQQLRLSDEVDVDIRQLNAVKPGDSTLDALATNPPGLFCADINLGDVSTLDGWLDRERHRWQRRLADMLFHHAQYHNERGALVAAQKSIQVALQYEPLREEIVQLAMQIAYRSQDRAGAIALYEHLNHALDDQLGVPPMPATTELYDAIVTDRYAPSAPLSPKPTTPAQPFVGRSAELTQLHGASWDGRLVVISGDAGIGKTRLAHEFLRRSNALIIHAAAFDGDQVLPYHVIINALRTHLSNTGQLAQHHNLLAPVWQRELRRLWPELPGGDPEPLSNESGESRLPEALALLLQQIGQQQRVALFLDDAQWLDDATLRTILAILRRSLTCAWIVLLTIRPGTHSLGIQRLLSHASRQNQLTRIDLAPLNDHESIELARLYHLNATPQLITKAEGNPFMLVELLRYHDQRAEQIPEAIRDLIATRMHALSPLARRLLDAAAIGGRDFVIAESTTLAELTAHEATDSLDELSRHGFIRLIDAHRGRFDHPLTVESVLALIGPARIHHLHRTLAHHLSALDSPPHAQIVRHYQAAGDCAAAAPHALAAARHAIQLGAWSEAEYYMRLVIETSPPEQQALYWLELGEVLFLSGSLVDASEALRHAIINDESADGRIADQARVALARSYIPQARYDEAIALCEPLLDHPHQSIAMHAAFVCGTAHSLLGVDLAMARTYLERAERLSHSSNEHDILPRIYFEQGGILAQQGDIPAAIGRYHAALSAASTATTQSGRTWQIFAHNNLAYHIHLLGNYDEATRHARLGLRIAQRSGARMAQSYLYSTMGEIALAQGDLESAERSFFEGLDIAERYGILERIAGIEANIGLVARAREDIDSATKHLQHAMAKADALGVHHLAAQIRIWLATLVGDNEAIQRLDEASVLANNGERQLLLTQIAAIRATRGLPSKVSEKH